MNYNTGCGPVGCSPYAGYGYPYGYAGAPQYPLAGPVQYDIVGAAGDPPPAPAPTPGLLDKLKTFGQQETLGVRNEYLGLGAVAVGLVAWGMHAGWFGKRGRR